jgi:hypothetical protein
LEELVLFDLFIFILRLPPEPELAVEDSKLAKAWSLETFSDEGKSESCLGNGLLG